MFRKSVLTLAVVAAMTGCGSDSSSSNTDAPAPDVPNAVSNTITMSFKGSAANSVAHIEYLVQKDNLDSGALSAPGAGDQQTSRNFY